MKYWTSEHVFDYPWHTTVEAAYRKYPNPHNQSITGMDVLRLELKDGVLHNERILQSDFHIPIWAKSLTGFSGTQYSFEVTKIDPNNRRMQLLTRNLNLSSLLRVDERLEYTPHPTDPNKTLLKQEASVEVNLPAFTDYCEKTFLDAYQKNALKGRRGLEWVIDYLRREYQGFSKKPSKIVFTKDFDVSFPGQLGGIPMKTILTSKNSSFNSQDRNALIMLRLLDNAP